MKKLQILLMSVILYSCTTPGDHGNSDIKLAFNKKIYNIKEVVLENGKDLYVIYPADSTDPVPIQTTYTVPEGTNKRTITVVKLD